MSQYRKEEGCESKRGLGLGIGIGRKKRAWRVTQRKRKERREKKRIDWLERPLQRAERAETRH